MLLKKTLIFKILGMLVILCLKINGSDVGTTGPNHGKIVVCYLESSSFHKLSRGSFDIDNVDPTLCTHIVYAYAGLSFTHDGIISLDPNQDLSGQFGNRGYERVVGLKQIYPHLKITLCVGGWNQGSANFSDMARDPEKRQRFVASAVQFVRKYDFDGLDIEWHYPSQRGGSQDDKCNFALLVKELRLAFNEYKLLLTAVLGTSKEAVDNGYNIRELSYDLDYIHFLSMNYHGAWANRTGPNAPLRGSGVLNVEYMVKYLITLGASRSKLIMGIPLYGRTFLVSDEACNGKLGCPAQNLGFKGPFGYNRNSMGYNEVCLLLQNETAGFVTYWDEESQTPFAISGEKVISYDNERSISEKVKFATRQNLGGVMVRSLDTDDFKGDCGSETYPLLRSINRDIEQSKDGLDMIDIRYHT